MKAATYRGWAFVSKRIRFKFKRLMATCIFGISLFTTLFYVLQHQSIVGIMHERTQKVLNAINKNTSSLLIPNESTTILEASAHKSCKGTGSEQFLLFMFITSPENVKQRDTIRQLFANRQNEWESSISALNNGEYPAGESIKFLFFIGLPHYEEDRERLTQEWKSNGDIVVDEFQEAYLNLTLKTLRMLKWVSNSCPDVRYLVKIDDDVHLSMPKLLHFLKQYNETTGKNLIAGRKYPQGPIDSDPLSKWFTPNYIWSGLLPEFVAGFFYVLGSEARRNLYTHALETPLFHLEDVFLTGIVRSQHTDINLINLPGVYEHWPFTYNLYFNSCSVNSFVAVHSLPEYQIKCWSQFSSSTFQCGRWPVIAYCMW